MHSALDSYEESLGLYKKYMSINNLCDKYSEKKDNQELLEFIGKIKEII